MTGDLAPVQEGPPPNSTFQVGNVMVDYSALNIPAKLSGGATLLRALFDALFAFQVIGIVAIGLLFLISPPLIFSFAQFSFLRAIAALLAIIAAVFLTLVSVIETAITAILPGIVNSIGDGLGVSAKSGAPFLAMSIISSIFAGLVAGQWVINLIVSYHDRTYVRIGEGIDLVQDSMATPRERTLRRPVIRLNTPPERMENENEEKSFFSPRERQQQDPRRLGVFGGLMGMRNKRQTIN